jgi:hypothetical protein
MADGAAPGRCVVKSVSIDRPAAEVHAYLSDASRWPEWAVINVRAAEPSDEPGWWRIATAQGAGEIRIRADAATGVVDHDYRDADGVWAVPARVVANGRGAEFSMTFFVPLELDDEFDGQLALVETELATLKRVLEGRRSDAPS